MLKIDYGRLSTKVLGDLANRVLETIEPYRANILKDNPLHADLAEKNEAYHSVIMKRGYSGLGQEVQHADLKRDRVYGALHRLLQAWSAFEGTDKGDAARVLLEVIEELGTIYDLSYADENEVLQNLIKRFDEPSLGTHIDTLNLREEYGALKAAQQQFEKLQNEQVEADSALREKSTATRLRRALQEAIRNLFALVSAMRYQPEWKPLYHDLQELIKDARQSNRSTVEDEA